MIVSLVDVGLRRSTRPRLALFFRRIKECQRDANRSDMLFENDILVPGIRSVVQICCTISANISSGGIGFLEVGGRCSRDISRLRVNAGSTDEESHSGSISVVRYRNWTMLL